MLPLEDQEVFATQHDHSRVRELPHRDEDGHVISDEYNLEKLRTIRRRIRKDYYTPRSLVRIGTRIFRAHPMSDRALLQLSLLFVSIGISRRRKEVRERARLPASARNTAGNGRRDLPRSHKPVYEPVEFGSVGSDSARHR